VADAPPPNLTVRDRVLPVDMSRVEEILDFLKANAVLRTS
jgi:hypothetical protein